MLKNRTTAWIIWSIALIFYAYQYILRVMPNIMLDSITKQFNIDATVFGQYSGIYYIGYCLMHLPIGILLDKYGPRKIMTLCTLLTVMGLLPLIFSNTTTHLIIGRFLIGMGSSAAILGVFKIIRLAFEERQFTKMLSLSVMIGLIGAIYGGGPVNYLCLTIGDDMVVKIFAVMGMVLATLCYAAYLLALWLDLQKVLPTFGAVNI